MTRYRLAAGALGPPQATVNIASLKLECELRSRPHSRQAGVTRRQVNRDTTPPRRLWPLEGVLSPLSR